MIRICIVVIHSIHSLPNSKNLKKIKKREKKSYFSAFKSIDKTWAARMNEVMKMKRLKKLNSGLKTLTITKMDSKISDF